MVIVFGIICFALGWVIGEVICFLFRCLVDRVKPAETGQESPHPELAEGFQGLAMKPLNDEVQPPAAAQDELCWCSCGKLAVCLVYVGVDPDNRSWCCPECRDYLQSKYLCWIPDSQGRPLPKFPILADDREGKYEGD